LFVLFTHWILSLVRLLFRHLENQVLALKFAVI